MKIFSTKSNQNFKSKPGSTEVELSDNVRNAKLTHQKLEKFPYAIPEDNKLNRLDLSYNQIRSLPNGLPMLRTLFLPYNELQELSTELIDSLSAYLQLDSLDLSHNKFASFPAGIEKVRSIKKLDLANNVIEYISQINTTADTVDVSNNKLEVAPKVRRDLRNLLLDRNRIKTFDKSYKNLAKLSIGYNKLENVIPSVHLISLEILILSHNCIKTLPKLMTCTPKLKYFDAAWNKLTEFPFFPPTIEYIDLSNNKITKMPENMLEFEQLQQMDASHNSITEVPALPPSLTNINFFDNLIETVNESTTPNLRIMNFVSNRLTKTPVFKENKLPFLFLKHNFLKAFEFDLKDNFLTQLDLSNNELEEVPEELFSLTYLYILNLSSNKIKKFEFDFSHSHLSSINLSNNPTLECFSAQLPPQLEFLYLSNCHLSSLPEKFERNLELYYLDISENEIQTIPLFKSLATLKASHNKFTTFPPFANTIKFIDLSFNQIEFIPVIRLSNLTFIDLSSNKLTSFNSHHSIKHLYLSNNPLTSLKNDHLVHLDVSECPIDKKKVENVVQFVTSDSRLMTNATSSIFCHSFSEKHCISQHLFRDVYICYQQTQGSYIFCVLNANDDQIRSQKAVYLVLNKLHERKSISGDYLKEVCDIVVSYIDDTFDSPTSMFALGFVRPKSLIVAYYGGFSVTTVDAKGNIVSQYGRETRREDGLANLARQGEKMLFKIKRAATIRQIAAKADEKWAIVAPTLVLDTFSKKVLQELIPNSVNAEEIARKMKNHAAASPFKQSFSIGVFCFE